MTKPSLPSHAIEKDLHRIYSHGSLLKADLCEKAVSRPCSSHASGKNLSIMSTKLHRNPPFRAEHLGSLLRTDKLLEVRHANKVGKASDSELRTVEDSDVKDIVKTQLDLGYHAITDGEYRRHSM